MSMYSDAEIEHAAESYRASGFWRPEIGVPFWNFLRAYIVRPTHRIHWEEKGGSLSSRIAVAIRKVAGRLRPR